MSPTAQAIEVAKMKLMTKASNRRWFSISGETMALKQRTPENKKPRAKSAAETVARPNLHGYVLSSRVSVAYTTFCPLFSTAVYLIFL